MWLKVSESVSLGNLEVWEGMNSGGRGGSLVMQVFMRCTDREGREERRAEQGEQEQGNEEREGEQEDGKRMGICKDGLIGVAT